jgi:hypothetical protein
MDLRQMRVQIFDLRTRKISPLADSQGKVGAFWVTQDTLIAATEDSTKFLLFDFKSQKWTELASGTFVNWIISPDRKYLYCTTAGDEPSALRIRWADGRAEKITGLKGLRRVVDPITGTQLGVTPDGSILFTRDVGLQENPRNRDHLAMRSSCVALFPIYLMRQIEFEPSSMIRSEPSGATVIPTGRTARGHCPPRILS